MFQQRAMPRRVGRNKTTKRSRSLLLGSAIIEPLENRRMLSANVLSYRNDAAGDGLNLAETVLTPANTSALTLVATAGLDGQVYAQPLVVQGVNITTGSHPGSHDVVYIATENDSVYAIDT